MNTSKRRERESEKERERESKKHTPNATYPKMQTSGHSEKLRFQVCLPYWLLFGAVLEEHNEHTPNATHPKIQTIDHSEKLCFQVCCIAGCSLAPS